LRGLLCRSVFQCEVFNNNFKIEPTYYNTFEKSNHPIDALQEFETMAKNQKNLVAAQKRTQKSQRRATEKFQGESIGIGK